MKDIKKISDLIFVESFLQVNFLKGYKYIDKAGEIVNEFCTEDKEPNFSMDLNRLLIYNPEENVAEIKVSPRDYWSHFVDPDSLESISYKYIKNGEKILKILEVDKIQRIGWRNIFAKEFKNGKERDKVFEDLNLGKNLEMREGVFCFESEGYNARLSVSKANKTDQEKTPSIIIDIDFYKIDKEGILKTKVEEILNLFKKEIRSDFWIGEINKIINSTQKND
ncbi:MAG: hypothetical protein PHU94_03070 [Bacilli bacterium]|nr:hypothetical protein [Bacilli bacterium]